MVSGPMFDDEIHQHHSGGLELIIPGTAAKQFLVQGPNEFHHLIRGVRDEGVIT